MGRAMTAGRCVVRPDLVGAIGAALLILSIGTVATLRQPDDRDPPARLPAAGCTGWMADALPRVGPRSRDAVAAAIRRGEIPPAGKDWFDR